MEIAHLYSLAPIVLLIGLSAFFSGSETAVTAASKPRMQQLEANGDARAAMVNRMRDRSERVIGAILLGNNLVNILASAIATSLAIEWFGKGGVAYATLAMTLMVLIFAEVMPKTYAINHADRVALTVAPILRAVVWAFAPVSRAVEVVVRGTLKMFGVTLDPDMSGYSEEELRGAIELHQGEEYEIAHERQMLRNILDLADVEVGEVMTPRGNMITVDADLPTNEIIDQVLSSAFTRIPVWRKSPDNIIAVVHAKALVQAVRTQSDKDKTRDKTRDKVKGRSRTKHMPLDFESIGSTPWFVPETTSLLDQLHAFRDRKEHFALVVDEYGALEGIVTLEDILEEIVGEILDELDPTSHGPLPGVRPQPDGAIITEGTVTIRDLNREFDWTLPDEEASTIAGLVLYEAQRIPVVGQVFRFHGFRFEILQRDRQQITLLRMTPEPDPDLDAAPAETATTT